MIRVLVKKVFINTIPMQSKMGLAGGTSTRSLPSLHGVDNTHTSELDTCNTHGLAGGTSTCSLPSVHGVNNTRTSTLDTCNTQAIKNGVGRRNFDLFSSFSSQGQQHAAIHLRSTHAIPMGWQAKPQRDLFLQFKGSTTHIHLSLTPAIPLQ